MLASRSPTVPWTSIWPVRSTAHARSALLYDVVWIVALSGVLFLTRLGAAKLWDRDEPRNARCAVEMLQRADWIVPTFNGELRAHKPVLLYWAMMASYLCFGETEFAARFGSAGAAVGTVVLTYLIGRRLYGRATGQWASVVLSTALMFHVAAHAATPDSLLIFFSTLGLTVFVFAGMSGPRTCDQPFLDHPVKLRAHKLPILPAAALHGALALAVLAKGPVGWILPVGVMFVFSALSSWRDTSMSPRNGLAPIGASIRFLRPGVAILMLLVVAAPWYLAVGWKTQGEWLRIFFWEHHVSRATQTMEGHSGHPLLYYPAVLLVGLFPWSIFAVPGAIWLMNQKPWRCGDQRLLLLLSWMGVYVFLFSAASTKLPSYVTPCYPALAILCGQFLREWPSHVGSPARWWLRWSAASLVTVGLAIGVGLSWAASEFLPHARWVGAIALIPIVGGMGALRLFWFEAWHRAFQLVAGCGAAMWLAGFALIGPQVSRENRIEQLLHAADEIEHDRLVSYGVHEPSWIYYAKRTISFLPGDQTNNAAKQLSERSTLLITSRHFLEPLQRAAPSAVEIVAEVPNFLDDDSLLLVRSAPTTSTR